MIIRHNTLAKPAHRSFGFSMIDVLVAIIVLAISMLALAALQGTLTRNTADARARSQLAAFSEGLLEQARSASYDCVGSANAACATATTNGTVTITPSATGTTVQKNAYRAQAASGVSNLSIAETVATYYANAAGSFSTTAPTTVDSTTPQYKQVKITATWTDASAQARALALDSIVSPVEIDPSNTLTTTSPPGTVLVTTPVVRELNPIAPGVIPIAVGNGNDTAATNPKPEILGTKGNQAVIGTSYNVLTYQAPDANNEVQIQKRVETQVLQCTCKYGTGSTSAADVFAQAYRPTYWDGSKYVAPKATPALTNTNSPGPAPGTTQNPVVQSDFCLDCCRDHHDVAGDTVKFDPFNKDVNSLYKTYNYDSSNNLAVAMGTTDVYVAACRLIRVDGQYRTATDLYNDHFGLLATKTGATVSIPDDTYVAKYQTFVKDYLTQAYVTPGTGVLTTAAANTLYATDGLDAPTQIDILYNKTTPDKRYLHARGLYIDHLETLATKAISDALGTCTNTDKSQCVLPLLPFTTINATELANWCVTPSSTGCPTTNGILQVSNSSIIGGDPLDPKRGVVQAEATAKTNDTSTIKATLAVSNSGVAVGYAVDPDDVASLNDSQFFKVTSGASSTSVPFLVNVSGLPNLVDTSSTDDPSMSWKIGTSSSVNCLPANTKQGSTITTPPYTCTTGSTAATSTDVLIGPGSAAGSPGYNTTIPSATKQSTTCGGPKSTLYTCQNYQVDTSSIKLNGVSVSPPVSVTGNGLLSEQSTITFATLDGSKSNAISIAFKAEGGATNAPYTCSSTKNPIWTYPSFCAP
ncbi:MAG: hypothetical protein ABIQ78_11795 [Dokdonella sp.]